MQYIQIFRSSSGALARFRLSVEDGSEGVNDEANTGGAVPPAGPLTRLLSLMFPSGPYEPVKRDGKIR